jgi:hypothetical protein
MSYKFEFYDLDDKKKSNNINFIFNDWDNNENVVIFSPHDDDCVLGAGYAILSSLQNNAKVYIIIFHDGSAGYSQPELKGEIVEIRKKETINALRVLGIDKENIFRLDIPDFSGIYYLGWKFPWASDGKEENEGLFSKLVSLLRKIKATRLIIPNGYLEHIDHTATFLSGIFTSPQAGDAIIVDYGAPQKIKSFLQYSVWGEFSPENALIKKRNISIRGNRAIVVNKEVEDTIIKSIMEFKTQQEIISSILGVRKERKITNEENYVEIYLEMDPRPRVDYNPYKDLILKINKNNK